MKREAAHTPEYERFDNMMQRLIRVPHAEIKAKLEAEKRTKERKKKRKPKTAASGRVGGGKG